MLLVSGKETMAWQVNEAWFILTDLGSLRAALNA
jgi:hypothetical protein